MFLEHNLGQQYYSSRLYENVLILPFPLVPIVRCGLKCFLLCMTGKIIIPGM